MGWNVGRVGLLAGTLVSGGCGDDAVGAGDTTGEASTGADSGGVDASSSPVSDTSADDTGAGDSGPGEDTGAPMTCMVDADCDDDNPCTDDDCAAGLCTVDAAVQSNACRPQIDVEFPPRGATLLSASPVVTVVGTVTSAAAAIDTFRINGQDVPVARDGSFSLDVTALTGGNTLVFETVDALDVPRRRVQSFLWSTDYRAPTLPVQGIAPHGLDVYLDQETIDDGDRSLPADDIATLLGLAVADTDIGQFVDPTTPVTSSAGYNVYVGNVAYADSSIQIDAIDGGLRLTAALLDVTGDLVFDCTIPACQLAGGDGTGDLAITSIEATADLMVGVDASHDLVVTNAGTQTNVVGLDITSNNAWTNFLITILEPFILGGVVADIEAEMSGQLDALLGPALSTALSGLAPNAPLSFPNLTDAAMPIAVQLVTDFQSTDFHDGLVPPVGSPPAGGVITLRGAGYAADPVAPHLNLGVPDRAGCGTPGPDLELPRAAALEIGLTDDLLNSLLHGAWRGGLLEFDVPAALLPADGLVSDVDLHISGMLAPTASDCARDGLGRVHLGDVQIEGGLTLQGQPVTFTAYSSLTAGLEYTPSASGVAIGLAEIEAVDTELTVNEDDALGVEELLRFTLEQQLVEGVVAAIAAGGLGEVNLPAIDLSSSLGLPAGTAVVQVATDDATRAPGGVVISGHL
jgi:hypothetical protein